MYRGIWILLLCSATALAQHSDPTPPTGFPNVARTPGQLIAGLIAPTQGRTALLAYHNGVLFSVPEAPSSNPGSDLQVRTWNIRDETNLANPVELQQWGVTWMPIEAHGYFKNGDYLSIGDNRDFDPDLPPWAFAASGSGVIRQSNPEFVCAGVRGCVFAPWILPSSFWSYTPPSGNARIAFGNWNNTLAEWDHLGQTGVLGHPFLLGNIVIYASDQSRTGIAAYDVSDPTNPLLLDVLTNGGPGGYWAELWGGGDKLYVVFPYRNNGNGMRVADITDPTDMRFVGDISLNGDEAMYAQFQDEYAFIGSHKIDMRSLQSVQFFDPDTAWSNSYGSGTRISTSQFALPLGNLLVTGGAAPDHGMAIWAHQAEADTRAPTVAFHIPRAGQSNWPSNRLPVTLLIHETLESPTIINGDTFIVRPVGGAAVAGQITFSFDDILTFTPATPWQPDTTYEVFIPGGGIKDAAGNGIEEYSFSFTTGTTVVGNTAPMVDAVNASLYPVAPGQSVTLTALATDAQSQAMEYRFDFGDGSPKTAWGGSNSIAHSYPEQGHYRVVAQVRDTLFATASASTTLTVTTASSALATQSTQLLCESPTRRVYSVNPDSNTLTAVNADTLGVEFEVAVCADPRSVALAGSELWIACHDDDALEVRDAANGSLIERIATAHGSAPIATAAAPDGSSVYATLHGSGMLLRYQADTRQLSGTLALGPTARALAVSADGSRIYVSRFLSTTQHAEIWEVNNGGAMSLQRTLRVRRFGGEENADGTGSGRGIANQLRSLLLSRDGQSLWFTANKANTQRGTTFFNDLDQDNTLRNIVVQLSLSDGSVLRQVDIDNSDSASAVSASPLGDYLLVALQGNNEVAVFDALSVSGSAGTGGMVTRLQAGLAPQGVCTDALSGRSYAQNFMDRSLSAIDSAPLFETGNISLSATLLPIATETLTPEVLLGKQIFYNAADTRMSAEGYIACASCHLDGGHDGRTWDFSGRGEGLRNTTSLRGRAGMSHGNVHWSANFDEIQDFEHDIRGPFGGSGFMSEAQFNASNTPLGPPKAGRSATLDALAAYVASLGTSDLPRSPYRQADGTMTAQGDTGEGIFVTQGCSSCHAGARYTDSPLGSTNLRNVGTLRTSSGNRLGGPLSGIDTPTLLGLWNTAPYFHDGSAPTLADVFAVAGGPVLQAESGLISGGASLTGSGVWTYTDDSFKGRAGVHFTSAGHRLSFANVDGGAGGLGAVELRYSAGYQALQPFVISVNGVNYPVQLPNTGNNPGWLSTQWRIIRFENIAFAPGNNTVSIQANGNLSTTIDEVQITRPAETALADPHRRVLALSSADRDALMAFLLQIDGSIDEPLPDPLFEDGFE